MTKRVILSLLAFTFLLGASTPINVDRIVMTYTDTALAGAAVYTSASKLAGGYKSITGIAAADEDSATDGLQIQQSTDAACDTAPASAKWDYRSVYTLNATSKGTNGACEAALKCIGFTVQLVGRCARIVYTNSASAQGEFRLAAYLVSN